MLANDAVHRLKEAAGALRTAQARAHAHAHTAGQVQGAGSEGGVVAGLGGEQVEVMIGGVRLSLPREGITTHGASAGNGSQPSSAAGTALSSRLYPAAASATTHTSLNEARSSPSFGAGGRTLGQGLGAARGAWSLHIAAPVGLLRRLLLQAGHGVAGVGRDEGGALALAVDDYTIGVVGLLCMHDVASCYEACMLCIIHTIRPMCGLNVSMFGCVANGVCISMCICQAS